MWPLLALLVSLCGSASALVELAEAGNECPVGFLPLTSAESCRAALDQTSFDGMDFQGSEENEEWPKGCYYCRGVPGCVNGVWFNEHSTGSAKGNARPICARGFEPLAKNQVLFMGDSDIDFWPTSSSFEGAYNVGYGGYTCLDVIKEIDRFLATFQPRQLVLVCGENDLAGGASVATTLARLDRILEKTQAANLPVVFLGTKPEPDSRSLWKKYEQYDQGLKDRAKRLTSTTTRYPSLVFIDSYQGFLDAGNGKELYANDQLHLSNLGYRYWTQWTANALANTGGDCLVWLGMTCQMKQERTLIQSTQGPEVLANAGNTCPDGYSPLTSPEACVRASLGFPGNFGGTEDADEWPTGCYYYEDRFWFNSHRTGAASGDARPVCIKDDDEDPDNTCGKKCKLKRCKKACKRTCQKNKTKNVKPKCLKKCHARCA